MHPGISLHREFELLAEAGIPNAHVLQMATMNGAIALGLEDEIGSIEVGKQANLVLLGADPLEDISATRRIRSVFLNGVEVRRR